MIEGYQTNCPLCRLTQDREILTRVVYEDDLIMVVDCQTCRVPMAVLKAHRASFSESEKERVRRFFNDLLAADPVPLAESTDLTRLFGGELLMNDPASAPWVIDWEQRKIPDHAHCHLRPKAFPGTRHWERVGIC